MNSYQATQVRIWATRTLKEFLVKGFVLDDERMKQELSSYPILEYTGKVSALEARLKAEREYEEYRKFQDRNYISDFDREIKRISGKE